MLLLCVLMSERQYFRLIFLKVVERDGAEMVAADPVTQKLYYVLGRTRIVEDSLTGSSNPTTIVDNIYSVGDMVYDPR